MNKKSYRQPEIVRGPGLPIEGPVIKIVNAQKSGGGYVSMVRLTVDTGRIYYYEVADGVETAYRRFKQNEERRAGYREAALSVWE